MIIDASEMETALKIKAQLKLIGVEAEIIRKAEATIVRGVGRDAKPFNIRIKNCPSPSELDAFGDFCERERAGG